MSLSIFDNTGGKEIIIPDSRKIRVRKSIGKKSKKLVTSSKEVLIPYKKSPKRMRKSNSRSELYVPSNINLGGNFGTVINDNKYAPEKLAEENISELAEYMIQEFLELLRERAFKSPNRIPSITEIEAKKSQAEEQLEKLKNSIEILKKVSKQNTNTADIIRMACGQSYSTLKAFSSINTKLESALSPVFRENPPVSDDINSYIKIFNNFTELYQEYKSKSKNIGDKELFDKIDEVIELIEQIDASSIPEKTKGVKKAAKKDKKGINTIPKPVKSVTKNKNKGQVDESLEPKLKSYMSFFKNKLQNMREGYIQNKLWRVPNIIVTDKERQNFIEQRKPFAGLKTLEPFSRLERSKYDSSRNRMLRLVKDVQNKVEVIGEELKGSLAEEAVKKFYNDLYVLFNKNNIVNSPNDPGKDDIGIIQCGTIADVQSLTKDLNSSDQFFQELDKFLSELDAVEETKGGDEANEDTDPIKELKCKKYVIENWIRFVKGYYLVEEEQDSRAFAIPIWSTNELIVKLSFILQGANKDAFEPVIVANDFYLLAPFDREFVVKSGTAK